MNGLQNVTRSIYITGKCSLTYIMLISERKFEIISGDILFLIPDFSSSSSSSNSSSSK